MSSLRPRALLTTLALVLLALVGATLAAAPAVAAESVGQVTGRIDMVDRSKANITVGLYAVDEGMEDFDIEDSAPVRTTSTSAEGTYGFADVAPGRYAIRFGTAWSGVAVQWLGRPGYFGEITRFDVVGDESHAVADTTLVRSSRLRGQVSVPAGASLDDYQLVAVAFGQDDEGDWVPVVVVDVASGGNYAYDFAGLRPGAYRLGFFDLRDPEEISDTDPPLLDDHFWTGFDTPNGAQTLDDAKDYILPGGTSAFANAALKGPEIVTVTPFTVAGSPTVGATLTVTPGVWSPPSYGVEYVWSAYGNQVGVGTTFTPTYAHSGAILTVTARVTKKGYRTVEQVADLGKIAPPAPTGVRIVQTFANSVSFGWTRPTGDTSHYKITVSQGSTTIGGFTFYAPDAFGYSPTLMPNTAYVAEVRAQAPGSEVMSAPITIPIKTAPMGRPGTPRAVAKSKSSVTLNWTRPTGGSKYRVVYWTGKKAKKVINLGDTGSRVVTGLKKKTAYNFYVQAISADGKSVTTSATIKAKTK